MKENSELNLLDKAVMNMWKDTIFIIKWSVIVAIVMMTLQQIPLNDEGAMFIIFSMAIAIVFFILKKCYQLGVSIGKESLLTTRKEFAFHLMFILVGIVLFFIFTVITTNPIFAICGLVFFVSMLLSTPNPEVNIFTRNTPNDPPQLVTVFPQETP